MKYQVLAAAGMLSLVLCGSGASAQTSTKICVDGTNPYNGGNSCNPVNASNPFPVTGTFTPGGTQSVNITQVGGNAVTTTVPVSGTITSGPLAVTVTNDSLSLTLGGTAQNAIASNAARKACTIQNPLTSTDQGIATAESLYVNFGGAAAAASTSFVVLPGQSISCAPSGNTVITAAVSVVAATTAHKIIVVEYN